LPNPWGGSGLRGLLHPVRGDVQRQRADDTALRNTILGAMQPALLDHARLQPLRDHPADGQRAEHAEDVVVGGLVERRCQICVWRPLPLRALALDDPVDRFDRVVAAAARPEAVGLRLEPRLALGLQRTDDPCLMAPIGDHGNSGRAALGAAAPLWDVHAPDRQGLERLGHVWVSAAEGGEPAAAHRVSEGFARASCHTGVSASSPISRSVWWLRFGSLRESARHARLPPIRSAVLM
jgi:hypothetical protein